MSGILIISIYCDRRENNKIDKNIITDYNDLYYIDLCSTSTSGANATATIYGLWIVKNDSFTIWRDLAGLSSSTYTTLESIVTDSSAMNTIMNNPQAVSYMIQSTGSIMNSVLDNDIAFNSLTSTVKAKIKNNEHWVKFAELYDRSLN